MSTTTTPLLPGNWYHIYNRGINGQNIIFEEMNYNFLLELMAKHLLSDVEIYAYCLLSNHFHFLVRICDMPEKKPHLGFSNLFNSYAQAVNKRYNRTGSLFEKPFRRKLIHSEKYLRHLLYNIHSNPVHHKICADIVDYEHSSYASLLSSAPTKLMRDEVLSWFDTRDDFVEFHAVKQDLEIIEKMPSR